MLSTFWRRLEDCRTKGEESKIQDKGYKKPAVSEEVQQLNLKYFNNFFKPVQQKYGIRTVCLLTKF